LRLELSGEPLYRPDLAEKSLSQLGLPFVAASPSLITASDTKAGLWAAADYIWTEKQLRHVTAMLAVIWFALAFGSYGILIWAATLFYDMGRIKGND
jgi:hypothetical protein